MSFMFHVLPSFDLLTCPGPYFRSLVTDLFPRSLSVLISFRPSPFLSLLSSYLSRMVPLSLNVAVSPLRHCTKHVFHLPKNGEIAPWPSTNGAIAYFWARGTPEPPRATRSPPLRRAGHMKAGNSRRQRMGARSTSATRRTSWHRTTL